MMMRNLLSRWPLLVGVVLLALLIGGTGAAAQDTLTRDPQSLAERYLHFSGEPPLPVLTPIYKPGDHTQFWVAKTDRPTPTRVNATLVATAPNIYLWVEDGLTPTGDLATLAQRIGQLFSFYQRHDLYYNPVNLPRLGVSSDPTDLIPLPDVDNDPHLYILYTSHLSEQRDALYNPLNSLPVQYAPYSNQHEMLYVNTTPYSALEQTDPIFISALARGLYRLIMQIANPQQAAWLTETLNWSLMFDIQQQTVSAPTLSAFLQAPDTPLLQLPDPTSSAATLGAQQLFINYFVQRYSIAPYTDLFLQPGSGVTPIDAALTAHHVTDPVSGAPVTARDAFADFVIANAVNTTIGDWRYIHRTLPLPQGQSAATTPIKVPSSQTNLTVNQFATQYFVYTASAAQSIAVSFNGSPTVPRLNFPADRDPADRFYWSGGSHDADATLTRAVDLSGVKQAALTFDAWYDLAADWNYGYVSASTDNGATWQPLAATTTGSEDRNGAAYGVGFTGISNSANSSEPIWLHETVDLTPFAGKHMLLRFEAITLPGHEDQGFAVDNLAIPAIHFSDDAAGDPAGWTLNGWQQIDNQLPQRWIVQAVTSGTQTTLTRVHALISPEDSATSLDTTLPLDSGEALLLAISGANDDTLVPASFSLAVK